MSADAGALRLAHRNQVQARAVYVDDGGGEAAWCVEVGHLNSPDPEIQGWGPDLAAAALACAEEAFLSLALRRGDFNDAPVAAGAELAENQ